MKTTDKDLAFKYSDGQRITKQEYTNTEKKKTWKRKVPKRFGLNRMPYHPDKRTKTFTHTIETDWVKNLKNTDIGVWRDSSCVGRPSDKKPVCTSTTKNIAVQRNNSILESRSFI